MGSLLQHMTPFISPRILVFDSGVGGLSIVSEIRALLPTLAIDYLVDNAFFPYGTKQEAELCSRIVAVIGAAIRRLEPALVVVGCNSASTIALDALRAQYPVPFVGVVPAIKPAAQASATKTIGLLATEGTVMRDYTRALAKQFAHDCRLITLGSSALVLQAEKLVRGETPDADVVRAELAKLWAQPGAADMDAVVLGCTHFPLLKPWLQQLAPAPVQWVDSGAAIARRVKSLLPEIPLQHIQPLQHTQPLQAPRGTAFFTATYDDAICQGVASFGLDRCALLAT